MLMYFDFQTYRRMLQLARGERNPAGRRRMLVVLLILIPIVSTFHAVCFLLDYLVFPGLRSVAVRQPVFIVGHARSGTTLLHRLMAGDPRFSFFLMYEMFFPSLLQKKAIRFLAACDRRLLAGRIERTLRKWEERRLADTPQDMHATGLTAPEEDDFVHTFSCASGFWIVLFPYMGDLDFYFVDEWSPAKRQRLMRFYRECVKRQLYLNGSAKIHLSKNPTFSGRVESLIATFPDARIVVLMRHPFETIPSLLKLLQRTWEAGEWDHAQVQRSLRELAKQSIHTYRHPLEVLARHPDTRQAIVDYRDLVAAPKQTVEDVYRRLGLDLTPEVSARLLAEERKARAHERTYRYNLEEFGLEPDTIHAALDDLFRQYHWDDRPGPEDATLGGPHG